MAERFDSTKIKRKLQTHFQPTFTEGESTESPLRFGVQIIDTRQLAQVVDADPSWLHILLTADELDYCQGKIEKLAGRIAGKLAIMQAVGRGMPCQDIGILCGPMSKPNVQLSGEAAVAVRDSRVTTVALSISHERDDNLAVGFVATVSSDNTTHENLQVGTDIASVSRIDNKVRSKPGFLSKHFTPSEIDCAQGNTTKLAQIWAAKEAVAKALGTGFWHRGINWQDIAVLTSPDGKYGVNLYRQAYAQAQQNALHNWEMTVVSSQQNPMAFVIGFS